jgi:hypothetical protein
MGGELKSHLYCTPRDTPRGFNIGPVRAEYSEKEKGTQYLSKYSARVCSPVVGTIYVLRIKIYCP